VGNLSFPHEKLITKSFTQLGKYTSSWMNFIISEFVILCPSLEVGKFVGDEESRVVKELGSWKAKSPKLSLQIEPFPSSKGLYFGHCKLSFIC
jgi:hypothetical protein